MWLSFSYLSGLSWNIHSSGRLFPAGLSGLCLQSQYSWGPPDWGRRITSLRVGRTR
jgi:hypothetical protein